MPVSSAEIRLAQDERGLVLFGVLPRGVHFILDFEEGK